MHDTAQNATAGGQAPAKRQYSRPSSIRLASHLPRWTALAEHWLALEHGLTPLAITSGRDAWNTAHACGIVREAYGLSPEIVDAHIQSALERIFPNAAFSEPKRY